MCVENLAEKLKEIGEIEVTPDCEEKLSTKICRTEFFRKVTVLANGLKKKSKKTKDSFNNGLLLCFQLLSLPALAGAYE